MKLSDPTIGASSSCKVIESSRPCSIFAINSSTDCAMPGRWSAAIHSYNPFTPPPGVSLAAA